MIHQSLRRKGGSRTKVKTSYRASSTDVGGPGFDQRRLVGIALHMSNRVDSPVDSIDNHFNVLGLISEQKAGTISTVVGDSKDPPKRAPGGGH